MFAGILQFNQDNRNQEKLLNLNDAPNGLANIPFDDRAYLVEEFDNKKLTIVQQRRYNTHQSKSESGIISDIQNHCHIIAWARIDNRKALREELSKFNTKLPEHDTGLILAAYLQWHEACCEHLIGDFSFVIIDHKHQKIFMARDHLGVRPLYYYQDENCLAFATSMAILNKLPNINLTPSEQWIAYYMSGFAKNWEITAYEDIKKCLPAHYMQYKNQRLSANRYFDFNREPHLFLSNDEEYVESYRKILQESVINRLNTTYPVASESSGGLDSSTITAIAALCMPYAGQHLHALGYDEGELTGQYILDISRRFPVNETHFFSRTSKRNPHTHDLFLDAYGAPSEHGNSTSHEPIYNAAKKYGIRTLLSGFGGDEFITSEAPVALVEFWLTRKYKLFWSRQRGNFLTKPLHTARWLFNFYRHKNNSISSRSIMAMADLGYSLTPLKQEYLDKYPLYKNVQRYASYDAGKIKQNDFTLDNRWSPTISARFENCVLIAASYGLEYRWPLMDIRLLNMFLATPSEQKLGPGQTGRYLHRRAMNGLLPDDITWKEKSMRKVSKWQKILNVINRKITEHKLRNLSKSTLKKWQNNTSAPKSQASQKSDNNTTSTYDTLHPLAKKLLDPGKVEHLMEIVRNPQAKHEGEFIAAKTRVTRLQYLNQWLWREFKPEQNDNKTQS